MIKNGTRLQSQVCDTQVIVVRRSRRRTVQLTAHLGHSGGFASRARGQEWRHLKVGARRPKR